MTMNTSSSPLFSAVMASQRQSTSQKLRLLQHRRRPVRRALVELGTRTPNDRANNLKFAEDLLTIDANAFIKKWDFNPLTMKPTEASGTWEWKLVKPKPTPVEKEALKEKTELKNSLFSLVTNSRKQMFLRTVPVVARPTEKSVPEPEKSSVVVSEPTVSSSSSADEKPTEKPAVVVDKSSSDDVEEMVKTRLCADVTSNSKKLADCGDGIDTTTVITAPSIAKTISTKQLSITDFTQHRKRLINTVNNTDDDRESTTSTLQPPSKRQKINNINNVS